MPTYNTFDPEKGYEAVEFVDDKVLQSRELNDAQAMLAHRITGIAEGIYSNGDVLRDAQLTVNPQTGQAVAESGAIFMQGAVRGVPPASFIVPLQGTRGGGCVPAHAHRHGRGRPTLLNPAKGTPSYNKAGASRRQVTTAWGYAGDGQPGTFFGVYVVEDGVLRAKAARRTCPPSRARSRNTTWPARAAAPTSWRACRWPWRPICRPASRCTPSPKAPPASPAEAASSRPAAGWSRWQCPTYSKWTASRTCPPRRAAAHQHRPAPCLGVPEFRITARRTVTLVHGGFAGVADVLPDASVISIESVKQGTTNYTKDADYRLTAGQVDWSPQGAEPAPGSSYQVTYLYMRFPIPATWRKVVVDESTIEENKAPLLVYREAAKKA